MRTLLTLDYELFNGLNSGTVQNCLITPTEELLKVLDKHGFKATFFVDTVFLNRLTSLKTGIPALQNDWYLIERQLKRLSNRGHQLQLHLHPQWFNAKYENGKWESVLTDYKLSDMREEEVELMFIEGCRLIQQVCGGSPIAFRAGAYCLQTLSNYVNYFSRYGILIDSSVNRGKASKTEKYQWYDYLSVPSNYVYRFSTDITKQDVDGSFTEVSIPSYKMPLYRLYWNEIRQRIGGIDGSKWGDGTGSIGSLDNPRKHLMDRIKSRLRPSNIAASIDAKNAINLQWLFEKEMKRGGDYFLIMGHPKAFTPYSLRILDMFFEKNKNDIENVVVGQLLNN